MMTNFNKSLLHKKGKREESYKLNRSAFDDLETVESIKSEKITLPNLGMTVVIILSKRTIGCKKRFEVAATESITSESPLTFIRVREIFKQFKDSYELYMAIKITLEDDQYIINHDKMEIMI